MTLTLLLDLDDTLLESNMDSFIPAYFQALSKHLAGTVQPEVMLPALMSGTRLMLDSEDPSRTLQEVFEADFYPKLGVPKERLAKSIDQFYDEIFPTLGSLTRPREDAVKLVDWAFAQGHRVAIATDPLFPRKATYHRIRWAGLNPERFELVSSFETFHFSKSHPAYFAEVLGRLGWPEGPVLMVGNDVQRDLNPAQKLGLATFHVNGAAPSNLSEMMAAVGSLNDLSSWLKSIDPDSIEPSLKSREGILAILASTPAVMQSLSASLSKDDWQHEPSRDDWAVIEILCHLRDTELEIHHLQIEILLNETEAFIPRPDAGVWAKQRKYLDEDAPAAVRSFTKARLETLLKLKNLDEKTWMRKARHAIFGPTNFREIVSFMADHDRMHVRQAWNTLRSLPN